MSRGTIHNKDTFLTNVANQLGRKRQTSAVPLPKWEKSPQYNVFRDLSEDALLDEFVKQCEAIHTKVIVTEMKELHKTCEQVIHDLGGESLVYWEDPRFGKYGIDNVLEKERQAGMDVHAWSAAKGALNIEKAEKANIGITFSDVTLAESGTVVLFSDEGKGRSVSLLPKTYMAIIPKRTLVPRMTQATDLIHERIKAGEKPPSCINFISGPSNSADIELRLVVGVHGPVRVTYVVIEDD
ncbi:lactate utilization protein C [Salipaludibacillus sp. LMS25]|jgi:L-lactate dehydrogenase complex protein LldG|uniref:LutC/YkgG family protein n=1 Tax=Salipaludibacillus sp. LMS25 TaxID=2924031 RepID=UPI0020D040C8|nr:lactate utilization protein C [Salipaludibacillus sp. LMS25]UTR14272.1 lactate utilization protein C [Salipaludibacillus sp. LMS25]